uniref:G-protein coupled receptors family 1 profile domain-containing protein n=1 Tax=Romanomermis culicivorax TaxID=13658 RepID=A0A915KJA9_ROMCU
MTNETVDDQNQCQKTQPDGLFFAVTLSLLFVCLVALTVSVTLLMVVSKVNLLHTNVKYLLQQSNMGAALASFSLFAKGVYNLFVGYRSGQISKFYCLLLSTPYAISSQAFVSFLVAVGWERLWATIKRNDKDLKRPSKGVKILSVCLWSMSSFLNLNYLFSYGAQDADSLQNSQNSSEQQSTVCYCDTIFVTGVSVSGIVGYFLVFNVGSILIYWYVYKTNLFRYESFGINHAQHNLQERFQTSNNMRATRMLLPFVISQAFVGTLVGGAYSWLIYTLKEDDLHDPPIKYVNFLSSLYILTGLDYSLTPFLWIKYDDCLKTAAFKSLPILSKMVGLRMASTTKVVTVVAPSALLVATTGDTTVFGNDDDDGFPANAKDGVFRENSDGGYSNPHRLTDDGYGNQQRPMNITSSKVESQAKKSHLFDKGRKSKDLIDYRLDPENADEIQTAETCTQRIQISTCHLPDSTGSVGANMAPARVEAAYFFEISQLRKGVTLYNSPIFIA